MVLHKMFIINEIYDTLVHWASANQHSAWPSEGPICGLGPYKQLRGTLETVVEGVVEHGFEQAVSFVLRRGE